MKNLLLLIAFCTLGFVTEVYSQCSPDNTAPIANCKGTPEIDQQVLDAPGLVTGNHGWAQSFTAGKTGLLAGIKFITWVEYGPTNATFTAKIVSGGDPAGGMELATKDFEVTNNNTTEYLIEFPTPPSITAGNQYCIVVSDNGLNPGASISRIKAEAYDGGSYYVEITAGQYLNIASVDLGFTTYVITGSSALSLELGPGGTANITGNNLDNNSTDNCAISSYAASPTSFGCSDIGTANATLTVTDAAGNSATCKASVFISDPNDNCCEYNNNVPPIANCKGAAEKDIEILDAPGLVTGSYGWAQSFTAGKTGQLAGIKFKTWVSNGPTTATFTAKIVSGGDPAAGMELASKDFDVTDNSQTEYLIEFPIPPSITAGNQYCIVVLDNGIDPGSALARVKAEDYAGGTYYVEIAAGQYLNIPTVDLGFTTFISTGGSPLALQIQPGGSVSITGADIDNNSTDNCGIASYVAFPTSFDCSDIGMANATLTVTDYGGNSATCVASVSISDPNSNCCQGPVASCNNHTAQLDNNGDATISASDVKGSSTADCGLMSEMVSPSSFNCTNVGPNMVTYTLTDNSGAMSSCTAVVTVEDNTPPMITCQGDVTVSTDTDACETTVTLSLPTNSDNCGVTVLRHRHREVDSAGDDIPGIGWSGWTSSTNLDVVLAEGNWKIQWQAKDAANNQKKCSFLIEVKDDVAPNAVCYNNNIDFNGEGEITLLDTDVWNEMASSDNCGTVLLLGFSPASVTCDQIGTVVPVTVEVEDASGNPSQCTANLTIGGLPCGWSSSPDGVNCPGGSQAGYDPNTGNFTVGSEGCFNPNFYSNTDLHGYVGTQLCGDGEIIAQVTQVSGTGYAGVSMRESLDPGAKLLQLGIDGVMLTKRRLRSSTGGVAFNHLFQTQGKNWLRLTRSGNTFTAQHSSDGSNWGPVIVTNIAMPSCIEVGFFAENNSPNGTVNGTFENVEIKTSNPLVVLDQPDMDIAVPAFDFEYDISVYPNPSTDEAWIDLGQNTGQANSIAVFNSLGQLVHQIESGTLEDGPIKLQTQNWENGLYWIKIQMKDQEIVTKKLLQQK